MKPLLIVVTGRPGSGKTTLANRIAEEICCPLLSRDALKEGYCVTHDAEHTSLPADTNRKLYDVYFDLVQHFLDEGISVVLEAAFQHKLWEPKLEPLLERADVRIVRCQVDPQLARERMVARGLANPRRERFHRDFAVHAAREGRDLPIGTYAPPEIDVPTLDVDTSGAYEPFAEAIVAFVMRGRRLPT